MSVDLYTPYPRLGLKNRAVMAPMTRYACQPNGSPDKALANYYVSRAEGGVGLIIIESSAVNSCDAMGYVNGAQFHSADHSKAWRPIVQSIHDKGAKVWLQLFHAGRLTVEAVAGTTPLAPSPVLSYKGASFWRPEQDGEILHFQTRTPYKIAKEMNSNEIERVIMEFSKSCALAEETGFDGVELHGAHGYLLHEFCHSETNERKDSYRAIDFKFITDLVKACRAAVSPDFKFGYRLSVHMVDSNYVRYDKEAFDVGRLVELLDEQGVDVFHSSELKAGSKMFGGEEALSSLIRKHTDKPIIICGRFKNKEKADQHLESGVVDLIAYGRSLISNPNLINGFAAEDYEFIKFDYEKHINQLI